MTDTLHKFFPGNSRERIQDLLRDRGMSQAELAEKIGMSESSLSRYLSGQTERILELFDTAIGGMENG